MFVVSRTSEFLSKHFSRSETCDTTQTWQLQSVGKPATERPLLKRLFGRAEPTTYHRCLAVHIHHAGPRGGLS
jgi:hypothetical protein